ncbi:MAG: alkylhydroperoxidase like protein AhpD family [Planctomycetaceae bacterium]|nr:alkylhydroperoxidase like protein AhpD family [Planctomycetaceae bacterium]
MFPLPPVTEFAVDEKVLQTLSRLRELFGDQPLPEPFLIYGRVPAFLQDFYMNFKKFVWTDGQITAQTKATIALAVCAVKKCQPWSKIMVARGQQLGLNEQYLTDTIAVAATCEMYNVFFKFRDISGSDIYNGMSVGLRAHTFANTSLDDKTIELINVVISDINGCKPCTSGHVEKARQLGVSHEALQEAIQCAATMLAGVSFLNAVQ